MADFDKAEQSERRPCEKSDGWSFYKRKNVMKYKDFEPSIIQDNEN